MQALLTTTCAGIPTAPAEAVDDGTGLEVSGVARSPSLAIASEVGHRPQPAVHPTWTCVDFTDAEFTLLAPTGRAAVRTARG